MFSSYWSFDHLFLFSYGHILIAEKKSRTPDINAILKSPAPTWTATFSAIAALRRVRSLLQWCLLLLLGHHPAVQLVNVRLQLQTSYDKWWRWKTLFMYRRWYYKMIDQHWIQRIIYRNITNQLSSVNFIFYRTVCLSYIFLKNYFHVQARPHIIMYWNKHYFAWFWGGCIKRQVLLSQSSNTRFLSFLWINWMETCEQWLHQFAYLPIHIECSKNIWWNIATLHFHIFLMSDFHQICSVLFDFFNSFY